ncbi:peroxisomal membrane protein PER10 [Scheffersomyces xylosifermentans]|uniref:peroxisomal membrane protein PER10 n=1 Tax=Scheffersomyces xylosifermentans TaxID=1304137 RepID=UPI00315C6E3E
MNEDLINSAVAFLRDPNVAGSPLTKKIEFLEAKGLSQEDVEEALRRVNEPNHSSSASTTSVSSSPTTLSAVPSNLPPIDYYNAPPAIPERSWKDYFIMATATAGVSYGLYQVVSRYLIPSIIPPSQSSIEKDKETIEEEFIKIDKILEQLSADQESIKSDNEAKLKEIDVVIDNVNDFLSKYNKDKLKFDDDLRLMKLEIDNLSNSIEKNMNLTKENIKEELSEINEELQSLKNLIKARGGSSSAQANGAGPDRKIPPVSSIPSASEILKKARAKAVAAAAASEAPKPEAKSIPVEVVEPVPEPFTTKPEILSTESVKPEVQAPSSGTTIGNITAAGIPAWQVQHKQKELQGETSNEKGKPETEAAPVQPGIPSWQSNASIASAVDDNNEELKKKISSVGVPSWQLNSTTPAANSSAAADEKNDGIPSWQKSA